MVYFFSIHSAKETEEADKSRNAYSLNLLKGLLLLRFLSITFRKP